MASPGFVHLDVRSYFSLKEGAFSPEDLAAHAAELGMAAVAVCDRDGLYATARFVAACEKHGVRPILGASLTLAASPEQRGRRSSYAPEGSSVVLIARDEHGYANLCRSITDAHMVGERGDPKLASAQVCAHPRGLTVILGEGSPVGRLAVSGRNDAALRALEPWLDSFGNEHLYIGVHDGLEADSHARIRSLLRLAERAGVRAVAVNPVRYLVPEDAFLADALGCMREIVPIASNNVSRKNAEGYLKSPREMRMLFAERPDLADATLEIAESCDFDIGLRRMHFPEFPTPAGRSASSLLAERCHRGIVDREMKLTREVRDRLDHELSMIHRMGFSAYFLTVADIVADVKAMGVRCACRGSAAGSLVCYLTGISDVDAVRHDLSFERFLNPLREELPDIDVDVESARREDVYDMVLSRYGDDRAACVAMIDTYRARAAVREVGKALGLPDVEVDTVAKAFPHISAHSMRKAIESLPELAGTNLNAGQLELLFRVCERLDGFPRHIALHPSGIVLSNHELATRVPLERSFQGYRMIQADKDDVELLGYLKLDVLGVRMLSSMRHALNEIARVEGEKVDLGRIPLDDAPTFELIRASDTLGCFQIESPGQRELLQKFQPERWEDLIIDISLFRPGPVKSDMISPFLRRRHGMERPVYAHPSLRAALRESYGVIVYHEQVMRTIAAIGGYDMSEADNIRRRLGDDGELPALREDFMRRALANELDAGTAERVWKELASFASFGFCKAHAAAFAVPTYQSAWLKTHYTAHFLAGVLTHDPGMYPKRLILEDARQHGIAILPLDIELSERDYTVERLDGERGREGGGAGLVGSAPLLRRAPLASESPLRPTPPPRRTPAVPPQPGEGTTPQPSQRYGIRLALSDVHGISEGEIRSILEAREDRSFTDVSDVLRRTRMTRPTAEALAHAGAFDRLRGGTRRDQLFSAMTTSPEREGDQLALDLPGASFAVELADGKYSLPDYTDAERVRAELQVLGLDASRHIVSFFEPLMEDLGVTRARDLRKVRTDEWVMVAGVKVSSQTPGVKSGQRIIFVTIDDATGPVEVTVFERAQPRCARIVFRSFTLAFWGRLRRTGVGGVSIIAEEAWDLAALHRARAEGHLREALEEPGRAGGLPPRKLWHASGGSAGW
jgi:error-prone DNA polymerase